MFKGQAPVARPWRVVGLFLALSCGFFLSGCSSGLIALIILLGLDDDDSGGGSSSGQRGSPVEVNWAAPENHRTRPDRTRLTFVLRDAESTPAQVKIEFSVAGGEFRPAIVRVLGAADNAPGPGPFSGLASSPRGTVHLAQWDAVSDLDGDTGLNFVTVRITTDPDMPLEECRELVSCDALNLLVGNDPPSIEDVEFEPLGGGDVRVSFRLEDSSRDLTDVTFEYTPDSSGTDFAQGALDRLLSGLSTTDGQNFHATEWFSDSDLGRVDRTVVVRMTPRDNLDGTGEFGATGAPVEFDVTLDNNEEPLATLLEDEFVADPDSRRGQALLFDVVDVESDPVDVIIQWAAPETDFPELPESLFGDPGARKDLLEDDTARRSLQIITLLSDVIDGRVEEMNTPLPVDGDRVLASWLKHSNALRGLQGLTAGGVPVPPATVEGRLLELTVSTGADPQTRVICSYDPQGGIIEVDEPFELPGAVPGERVRIDLGGVVRLPSAPGDGIRHAKIWASAADLPGGGAVRLRITAYDQAVDLGPDAVGGCFPETEFPKENSELGGRGDPRLTRDKELDGPFGLRDALTTALAPGEEPVGVTTANIDSDTEGRLDAVAVTRFDGTSSALILLLQTAPGFFDVLRFLDERLADPVGFAVADLDGDGDLDVAVAGTVREPIDPEDNFPTRPGLLLFFQEADQDFVTNRVVMPTDVLSEPSAVAAADIDGDGDIDIAVADADDSNSAVTVFHRDSTTGGTCEAEDAGYTPCPIGIDQAASDLEVADMDGDGSLDLVTSHEGVSIFLQESPGVYTRRDPDIPGGDVRLVSVVDLDADGNLDVVGADAAEGYVFIALQATNFQRESRSSVAFDDAADLDVGDLDRNGVVDFVIADVGSSAGVRVCLGDTNDAFSCDILEPEVAGAAPRAVAVGDVDGDGTPDIVSAEAGTVADGSGARVAVHLQDRPGNFSAAAEVVATVPGSRTVVAADFDGDGRLDLATSSQDGVTVVPQAVDSEPATIALPASVRSPLALAAGDIDGDGRADLATANVDSNNVAIFRQDNGGGFESRVETLTSDGLRGPESVALADLNGDGRIDVVTAGRVSGDVVWFSQKEDGSFEDGASLGLADGVELSEPLSVVVSDLDRDGRNDVVVAGHGSDNIVFFFQGDDVIGSFDPGVSLSLPDGAASPTQVVITDIDDDDDWDLVVAALGDVPLLVFRQSEGLEGDDWSSLTAAGAVGTAVAVADVNGDGQPDFAFADANETDPAVIVILGAGSGEIDFDQRRDLRAELMSAPMALLAIDLDGDGEADLVSANRDSGTLTAFPGGR